MNAEEIDRLAAELGDIYRDGSSSRQGWAYHKCFFEGYEIPGQKDACVDECRVILGDLERWPVRDKTVFEIGSAIGYFSFALAEAGYQVEAIEADPKARALASALKERHRIDRVRFTSGRFTETTVIPKSGVGLCLNVHMWVEKQIGVPRTAAAMQRLCNACERVYFQTSHEGASGKHKSVLKDEAAVEEYLKFCSGKSVRKLWDSAGHGRDRYLFRVG